MIEPAPEHGGYAWTACLARQMENDPMPENQLPDAAAQVPNRCPDDGACHHDCTGKCWRVTHCAPLSGSFPSDEWPKDVREQHALESEPEAPSAPAAAEVIHRCPIGADATTPCCGKSPFEPPGSDRITLANSRVTCAPTPTIVYHHTTRLLPPKPSDPTQPYEPWDPTPRPDPDDSYDCGLRDIHNDGEHHGIGWVDVINPVTDREQFEWVPYYLISYPDTANIKPLRVCEDCATYLNMIAPYLRDDADTGKLTDRIAFDYPTADALDALYYLSHAEEPATGEPLTTGRLDALDAHERSALGSRVLHEVHTPLTTSRAVLLQWLPYVNATELDALLHTVHIHATGLIHNTGETQVLIDDLARLNALLTSKSKKLVTA